MDKTIKASNKTYLLNNIYAIKELWSISKKRVINIALQQIIRYFEWLFYSIFFLRFVISSIEKGTGFKAVFQLIMICCAVFTITAIYNSYIRSFVFPKTDVIIYRKLYRKLYAKARNVELKCYEDSDFYSRFTMAIDGASTRITDSVNSTFNIVFGFVAASVAFYTIITIDVYAGLFLVFPLVGNFYFGKLVNSIYSGRYTDNIKNERKIQYINRVMYLSEYAKEIRYSNVHTLLMQKFNESVNDTVKVMDRYGNKGTRLMWFKNTLTFPIAFEGIMIYTAYRTIVSQSMSLADFAIIYGTMATTSWILIGLFNSITDSLKNGLFIGYVKSFLEYKEKIPEDQEGIMPENLIQSIEFRAVTFYYQEEEPILNNVSFKIENNACVALVGHNGAGKSTLIKLLLRLYDPVSGAIYVNGINIKEYNLKAYREIFSVAFQDYKIMAMSIKDNVLMGKRVSNPDEIVNKSLERVGLQDKIKGFPQGNETHLTKEFNSEGEVMSGGEYQKVIVARAFAQDSAVKIFDEPSSALDPIAEYELYNSIMQDRGKGIMIFISHRLSSVKDADYVYMMEHGAILEMGSHEALMEKGGIYSDMYKKQAMNYLAVENF